MIGLQSKKDQAFVATCTSPPIPSQLWLFERPELYFNDTVLSFWAVMPFYFAYSCYFILSVIPFEYFHHIILSICVISFGISVKFVLFHLDISVISFRVNDIVLFRVFMSFHFELYFQYACALFRFYVFMRKIINSIIFSCGQNCQSLF